MGLFDTFKNGLSNINPSNYQFVEKQEYERTTQGHYEMMADINKQYLMSNSRSTLPYPYMDTPEGSKVPLWRISPNMQYELADYVGDLRSVHETIQREMFKNGLKVQKKYKVKCLKCLTEYKEKPLKDFTPFTTTGRANKKEEYYCPECDNDNQRKFKKPNYENRVILQSLLDKKVNNNRQSLKIVARQFERDLDIIDSGYVLVSRRWKIVDIEPTKIGDSIATKEALMSPSESEIDEIIRINPIQVSIIANNAGVIGVGADNRPRYICPNTAHRDHVLTQPVCQICGCKAFNAFLLTNAVPFGLVTSGNPQRMAYSKEEIVWVAGKYMPDLLYGNSPIQSIWKKVLSLMHQDEYIWKYFDKDRPPKSLLAIGSRNPESVQAFMERQKQGARQDPYMPRPIMLNTDNVNAGLQFIDLTPNLKELELLGLRKELRQIISSVYGVQPLYYGEQAKAGLGNESLQVTLTNKTIKWFQRFLNEHFFAQIAEIFGIDDWEIILIDSEEIDKLRELQTEGQELDNVSKAYAMGFEVEKDGQGEWVVSQKPNPEKQEMMMSGPPGQNVAQGNPGKVKNPKGSTENQGKFGSEHIKKRPSDTGGTNGGAPATGKGTTLSNKSDDIKEVKKRGRPKGSKNKKTYVIKKEGKADVKVEVDETESSSSD